MFSASDSNSAYAYGFDGLGRLTTVDNAGTNGSPHVVLTNGHDAVGNRTTLAATVAGAADFLNSYSYDTLNRLTRLTQQAQTGGNAVAAKRVDFGYQADGQFSAITRYSDLGGTSTIAASVYGYDNAGRLTSLTHAAGSTTTAGYAWTYDAANHITSLSSSQHSDENRTYYYDGAGQLVGAKAPSNSDAEFFNYDANGNRAAVATGSSSSTYVTGANNKTVDDGTYTYTYDANGNTLTRTNKSTGNVDTYGWDDRNRLVQVVHSNSSSVTQWTVNYTYDVNNELIGRQKLDPSNAVVSNQRFVYDGQQIVLAANGAGNVTDRILWGPAVDQLLAQESVTSLSSAGATNWAFGDNQNTVRDWLDSTGTEEGHAALSSFGQQTSATGYAAGADVVFAYTGKYHDSDTGLQYNLNRWYDPLAGRWISEDPIAFTAKDPNITRYVSNDPANRSDSTGLDPNQGAAGTSQPATPVLFVRNFPEFDRRVNSLSFGPITLVGQKGTFTMDMTDRKMVLFFKPTNSASLRSLHFVQIRQVWAKEANSIPMAAWMPRNYSDFAESNPNSSTHASFMNQSAHTIPASAPTSLGGASAGWGVDLNYNSDYFRPSGRNSPYYDTFQARNAPNVPAGSIGMTDRPDFFGGSYLFRAAQVIEFVTGVYCNNQWLGGVRWGIGANYVGINSYASFYNSQVLETAHTEMADALTYYNNVEN